MLSIIDISGRQLGWATTQALGKVWAVLRANGMDSTNAGASQKGYMANGMARVKEGEDRTDLI